VLVNMDEGRKRLEHMRHDPRVALDLLDESDWYTHVSMTGHVDSCGGTPTWPTSTAWRGSTWVGRTRGATAAGSARGSPWTAGTRWGALKGQQPAGLSECLTPPEQPEQGVLRAAQGLSRAIADRTKSAIGSLTLDGPDRVA
jgi:hypothetical protein